MATTDPIVIAQRDWVTVTETGPDRLRLAYQEPGIPWEGEVAYFSPSNGDNDILKGHPGTFEQVRDALIAFALYGEVPSTVFDAAWAD